MLIIQIADLHITSAHDIQQMKKGAKNLFTKVRKETPHETKYIMIVCGDVIDAKYDPIERAFNKATKLFDYYKELFADENCDFSLYMLPGNHEIEKIIDQNQNKVTYSLDAFDTFSNQITSHRFNFNRASTYSKCIDKTNIILSSTVRHGNHSYGTLDLDSIRSKHNGQDLLFIHHSLFNCNKDDGSAIRTDINSLTHLKYQTEIEYIFNAHTHNQTLLVQFSGFKLINVRDYKYSMIKPSFNLIHVNETSVTSIASYTLSDNSPEYNKELIDGDESSSIVYPLKKIEYKEPSYYISRYIISVDDLDTNRLSTEHALYTDKKIVLLSEAGKGKSVELEHLANKLASSTYKYPYLYRLKNYAGQKISDIIPDDYKKLGNQLYLLFDSYDEVGYQYKGKFSIEINNYVSRNPSTQIIISSRYNFYNDNFDKFKKYKILDLDEHDISEYLRINDIQETAFYEANNIAITTSLLPNPFYLVKLATLFKEFRTLPARQDILKSIIYYRYDVDKLKYKDMQGGLRHAKIELFELLQFFGIATQLLGKRGLSDDEYHELIVDTNRLDLLDCIGIWSGNSDMWEFQHNNFREYLAAVYLSKIPKDALYKLIMNEDHKVYDKWINTVSYLVAFDDQIELLDLLKSKNVISILKFERTRVAKNERIEIFKEIIAKYRHKNLWIDRYEPITKNLVQFENGREVLEYIIDEISDGDPQHFRALSNALRTLYNFNELHGLGEKITEVLLDCCQNTQVRHHEKADAIETICELELDCNEVTETLLKLFSNEQRSEIRTAMYDYLDRTNLLNRHYKYLLYGIDCLSKGLDRTEDDAITMEGYYLERVLANVDSVNVNIDILKATIEKSDHRLFHSQDKIFKQALDHIIHAYQSGEHTMFINIIDIYIMNFDTHYHHSSRVDRFFVETDTLKDACDNIMLRADNEISQNKKIQMLRLLASKDIMAIYQSEYIHGSLANKPLYIEFLKNYSSYNNDTLREAVMERDHIELPIYVSSHQKYDYKAQHQNYFDALFSQEKYSSLLSELIGLTGNQDILISEIDDLPFDLIQDRADLHEIQMDLLRQGKLSSIKAAEFLNHIDWDIFSIPIIYSELVHRSDNIRIIPDHKAHIKDFFNRSIVREDLYNKTGELKKCSLIAWLIFFMMKFEFSCIKKILLDMLMLPTNYYMHTNAISNTYNLYDTPFAYLQEVIDSESLDKKVKENVTTKKLSGDVLRQHLKYCQSKDFPDATELALNVCREGTDHSYFIEEAVIYLCAIQGDDYVISELLDNASIDLVLSIAKHTQSKNSSLIDTLVKNLGTSKNKVQVIDRLLRHNSHQGIDEYTKMVRDNGLARGDDDSISGLDDLTRSIGEISDIDCLPSLIELIKTKFTEGFVDNSFYPLYNSLYSALLGMCTTDNRTNIVSENYSTIKTQLQILIDNDSTNMDLIGFCNAVLEEMNLISTRSTKRTFGSIQEVKDFLATLEQ